MSAAADPIFPHTIPILYITIIIYIFNQYRNIFS